MISGNHYLHKLISEDIRNRKNDNNNNDKKLENDKINNEVTRSKTSEMLRNKSMDNFLKFQWPWIL